MWILQSDFSQNWNITPVCFYMVSSVDDEDMFYRLNQYALKVAGEKPAEYGYVKIEGEGDVSTGDNTIIFCCESQGQMEYVYARIAEAILHHPNVIDFRASLKPIRII